ncbi:MAG: hypothetical protein WCO84_07345, partial [bacterium]
MDLNRKYNNPNLERKRKALLYKQAADKHLHQKKATISDILDAVFAGENPDYINFRSAKDRQNAGLIKEFLINQPLHYKNTFRSLVKAVEDSDIFEVPQSIHTLGMLSKWCSFWIRKPEDWKSVSHNGSKQLSALIRHLFCEWPVPVFMDVAWTRPLYDDTKAQEWFLNIGSGENIRKAN